MKGSPMKEKVILVLAFTSFIGIMCIISINQATKVTPIISEEIKMPLQESNTIEYIDEISPETTLVDDSILEAKDSVKKTCALKPIETDVLTFGDAFQYYRQCLGSDSSFHWNGNAYTTILAKEAIIQVADSVRINEESENSNQVSEIR